MNRPGFCDLLGLYNSFLSFQIQLSVKQRHRSRDSGIDKITRSGENRWKDPVLCKGDSLLSCRTKGRHGKQKD